MKQLLPLTAVAVLLVAISSCSTTLHSGTARTRNINESSIKETSTMADLKVDEQKVTGTGAGNNISDETAKNLAVYDALKKVNADVLVEPSYETDRTGSSITVTVSGFPGFYKNFHKPTAKDSLIMGWKVIAEAPVVAPNANSDNNSTLIEKPAARNGIFYPRNYPGLTASPAAKLNTPVSYDVDAYKKEKRKGNNLLGWGIGLFLAGVIVDGCSPLGDVTTYDDYGNYVSDNPTGFFVMLGVGSAMLVAGAAMIPAGAIHLAKAKRIKKQAIAQNMDISFSPCLNWANNRYGGTFALKF